MDDQKFISLMILIFCVVAAEMLVFGLGGLSAVLILAAMTELTLGWIENRRALRLHHDQAENPRR